MNGWPFWMVLSSIDPAVDGHGSLSEFAESRHRLRAGFDLARANGLYYPFARRMLEEGVSLPDTELERWSDEQQAALRFRRTLTLLGEVSRTVGIPYTIIKNALNIEQVPRDVDIFVREEDRTGFLDGLRSEGLRVLYDNESEISCLGQGVLRIDVYSRINYFNRDFVDPRSLEISRTTAVTQGVIYPTLAAEEAFLVDSAHALFGHGTLTLLDFVDLQKLRGRIPELGRLRTNAREQGWGRVFDLWMSRLDEMAADIYLRGIPISFPMRLGRTFILQCISALDGRPMNARERRVVGLTLAWDDLVYATEGAGLDLIIRRAGIAAGIANMAGHRIRALRGDRKSFRERTGET